MVERWDIITIGNLSRNRYWGESDQQAYRPALCTCTLVRAGGMTLLVDPSVADAERMAFELNRRAGLKMADISVVFVTHAHGDHHAGLRNFPGAKWLAARGVAEEINRTGQYPRNVEVTASRIGSDIEVIATRGHTLDHHSLRFDCDGMSVVVAGDAAMTRDFFNDRQGFHNSADFTAAAATIDHLRMSADIIIPGHDNYFLTRRTDVS